MQLIFYLLAIFAAIVLFLMFMGALAPIAIFALKAGVIRVPESIRFGDWDATLVWGWSIAISTGVTVLGIFGSFWIVLWVILGWPVGEQAYTAAYGASGCHYSLNSSRNYSILQSDYCLFGSVGNVIKSDAIPFFVATAITLYSRAATAFARTTRKSVWPFILPALVGGVAFFISTHVWEWLAIISGGGLSAVIDHAIRAAIHEVMSPIIFLKACLNGAPGALKTWFQEELIIIGASFYKLASLYPKVFLIVLIAGIVHYAVAPQV